MASAIDATKPIFGSPTTQSVRDNFLAAKNEIEALQAATTGEITGVAAGTGLTGGGTSGDVTLSLSSPVAVANGGTGAGTAAGAVTNLGAVPIAGNVTVTGGLNIATASGNVGIGTASPAQKLDVTGTIAVNGIAFASNDASFAYVADSSANNALLLGSAAVPQNAYRNTAHNFQNRTGSLLWVTFDATSTRNVSGAWATISDREMKAADSIVPYTRGLDAIVALNPCMFRYRPDSPFARADEESRDPLIGLIADEVEPHVPEIVGETPITIGKDERTISTLEPGLLVFSLINAVKTLAEQNTALTARIAALEAPAA